VLLWVFEMEMGLWILRWGTGARRGGINRRRADLALGARKIFGAEWGWRWDGRRRIAWEWRAPVGLAGLTRIAIRGW
jgi:hypothetical protein